MKRFAHSLSPVDTLATLGETLSHSDHEVVDGETVWVRSERCAFVYQVDSGLTPDGVSVIACDFAPGAWVRMSGTSADSWSSQLAWYIDPASPAASDENSGIDAAHPLLTGAEYDRRVNGKRRPAGVYHIFVMSDLLYPDYLRLACLNDAGVVVTLHGSTIPGEGKAVVYSSVAGITAHTVADPATNVRPTITDPAVPSGTWAGANLISSAFSPRRIRLTTGTNAGAIGFASKDEGAGKADTSSFAPIPTDVFIGILAVLPPIITPDNGDKFVVETLVVIDVLSIESALVDASSSVVGVLAESVHVQTVQCTGNQAAWFYGCAIGTVEQDSEAELVFSTSQTAGGFLRVPRVSFWACHQTSSEFLITGSANAVFNGHTIAQGVPLYDVAEGGVVVVGNAAVFDAAYGMNITRGGVSFWTPIDGPGENFVWGNGQAQEGLRVSSGCRAIHSGETYTVTGAGGDFTLGGAGSARAWDEATGTWTAAGTCTWTHLADTPVGANKFAGCAHNVQEDAHIVLEAP